MYVEQLDRCYGYVGKTEDREKLVFMTWLVCFMRVNFWVRHAVRRNAFGLMQSDKMELNKMQSDKMQSDKMHLDKINLNKKQLDKIQ
jgi:hypothetical protein